MEIAMGQGISKRDRELYSRLIVDSLSCSGEKLATRCKELFTEIPFDFQVFEELARRNKVLVRSSNRLMEADIFPQFAENFKSITREENARLSATLELINSINSSFEKENVRFLIMKTLDNLPDIGHDIDLLTVRSDVEKAESILRDRFGAISRAEMMHSTHEGKSVCDRLIGKKLFYLPKYAIPSRKDDPPEAEIYPCFSQLGEEYLSTLRFVDKRAQLSHQNYRFFIPCQEHRILISCLHSLFRHGVIRISELHNGSNWLKQGIDWDLLWSEARVCGTVSALSLFLSHVSAYCQATGVEPPNELIDNPNIHKIALKEYYPFKPANKEIASFWIRKGAADLKHGRIMSSTRALGFAPVLASLALIRYGLTGKTGIW